MSLHVCLSRKHSFVLKIRCKSCVWILIQIRLVCFWQYNYDLLFRLLCVAVNLKNQGGNNRLDGKKGSKNRKYHIENNHQKRCSNKFQNNECSFPFPKILFHSHFSIHLVFFFISLRALRLNLICINCLNIHFATVSVEQTSNCSMQSIDLSIFLICFLLLFHMTVNYT